MRRIVQATCTFFAIALPSLAALAQTGPRPDASLVAIRCDLHTSRYPDTLQPVYFYINDARRTVLETDGNPLGNITQYTPQRIVVTKGGPDGNGRSYVFDRLIGALTVSGTSAANNTREPWTLSGECQKVEANRQKF